MNIQPIKYGFKTAVKVKLAWGSKAVFEDSVLLIICLLTEDNICLEEIYKSFLLEEYLQFGSSKEERMNNLLQSIGIIMP